LLPFDASNAAVANQLTNSSSTPFPPPLACYPGLSPDAVSRLNVIEPAVFKLDNVSSASGFDPSCYAGRPIYGVLDLLQLRLPFLDSRTGAAMQAAVLSNTASPRAVLYSGEALSALPNATGVPAASTYTTDPRQYGTVANANHVLLNWFSAMNVTVAQAVVRFVLTSPTTPPPASSPLAQLLAAVPPLEVAVFGSVLPSDVGSVASSLVKPDGSSLFFGTDAALATRDWAINAAGQSVVWTNSTTAPLVVRDGNLTDATFIAVWHPVWQYLHEPNTYFVDEANITDYFQIVNKFSP
jgi:hypothetical protein